MAEEAKKGFKERIEICENCKHYQRRIQRCSICGCFMLFKARVTFAKCPKGYW